MTRVDLIIIHGCWDCPCVDTEEYCCGFHGGIGGPLFVGNDPEDEQMPAPQDCPLRSREVLLKLEPTK
jgi:hypothetical protein